MAKQRLATLWVCMGPRADKTRRHGHATLIFAYLDYT